MIIIIYIIQNMYFKGINNSTKSHIKFCYYFYLIVIFIFIDYKAIFLSNNHISMDFDVQGVQITIFCYFWLL